MKKHRKMSKKYRSMPINKTPIFPNKIVAGVGIVAVCCILGICAYLVLQYTGLTSGIQGEVSSGQASSLPASEAPEAPSEPEAVSSEPEEPVSITILGAGDNLIHDGIYIQANKRTGGQGYDFTPVYERVKADIQRADIAVINQETVLAGKILPLSGYPMFNSPTEVGDSLVDLGFDVICHANNHVLDKGTDGLIATLDYWDTQPVEVIGAYRNTEDLERIRIVESKGIKTAHLAFTEMTNGLSLPQGTDLRVVYTSEAEEMERLIKKAKSMADVVVVSVHWGNENTTQITPNQEELAQKMVDWGADIIFGNHAHVIQPLTVLTRSDGTKCPVIYAFGNFVSAQAYGYNLVSGLLTVTMTKEPGSDKVVFDGMQFKPIVTHYNRGYSDITIYPLSEYTAELAAAHGVRQRTPNFSLDYIHEMVNRSIPEEYLQKD
ncbi:MAG: CapA family protein [Hydrogeniiclostridium mannosilyticum]